jgi:hypothetical protein
MLTRQRMRFDLIWTMFPKHQSLNPHFGAPETSTKRVTRAGRLRLAHICPQCREYTAWNCSTLKFCASLPKRVAGEPPLARRAEEGAHIGTRETCPLAPGIVMQLQHLVHVPRRTSPRMVLASYWKPSAISGCVTSFPLCNRLRWHVGAFCPMMLLTPPIPPPPRE